MAEFTVREKETENNVSFIQAIKNFTYVQGSA